MNQLLQLKKLHESGILSADEFAEEKAKILNQGNTVVETNKKSNKFKRVYQKYRIPILIVSGMLTGLIVIQTILFFINNTNNVQLIEDNSSELADVENDIFEDKYEKLWVIGSTRDYSENDFEGWSKDDLKILRNYFFAKNNYSFPAKNWNDYFTKYSWYQPKYKDVGDMFSNLQINNVQYIKKLEGLPNYYK